MEKCCWNVMRGQIATKTFLLRKKMMDWIMEAFIFEFPLILMKMKLTEIINFDFHILCLFYWPKFLKYEIDSHLKWNIPK